METKTGGTIVRVIVLTCVVHCSVLRCLLVVAIVMVMMGVENGSTKDGEGKRERLREEKELKGNINVSIKITNKEKEGEGEETHDGRETNRKRDMLEPP
jgi:anionic cell wall polymer biosynthesis LytR-Cps2A-Psr (LCP) family protein